MARIILVFLFLFTGVVCFSQDKINVSVYFKNNKHDLDAVYKNKIDSAMQNHTFTKVDIKAYCDAYGSDEYNDALSLQRANAIKKFLVSKKLDEGIIFFQAFGKRFPLNGNESENARALNRRVDIVFMNEAAPVVQLDSALKNIVIIHDTIKITETVSKDTATIAINNVEVGKTFVLDNMNFYPGRHALLEKSTVTLELLLNTLKANPALEIEIQGHVCCQRRTDGLDYDTNTWDLSVNRAKTIYDYLVKHGIEPDRLSYKGFGSSQKLAAENTEEDRSTNRRVEIKVLKK